MHLLLWLKANWLSVALVLGVWSAVASALNKKGWPKPAPDAPQWKIVLHVVIVDLPAFLPSVNLKGLFGLPINVPFLSLSGEAKPEVLK